MRIYRHQHFINDTNHSLALLHLQQFQQFIITSCIPYYLPGDPRCCIFRSLQTSINWLYFSLHKLLLDVLCLCFFCCLSDTCITVATRGKTCGWCCKYLYVFVAMLQHSSFLCEISHVLELNVISKRIISERWRMVGSPTPILYITTLSRQVSIVGCVFVVACLYVFCFVYFVCCLSSGCSAVATWGRTCRWCCK